MKKLMILIIFTLLIVGCNPKTTLNLDSENNNQENGELLYVQNENNNQTEDKETKPIREINNQFIDFDKTGDEILEDLSSKNKTLR